MAEHATLSCDEFLELAAAAALDSIDEDETARVEEHARTCAECSARLDEFRAIAGALGSAVAQVDPPPELRSRVVEAVQREPRPPLRRLWPRALPRPRVVAPWAVAAASLIVSIVALTRVAMLQGDITDIQRNAVIAQERAARYEHVVQVLASDKLAIRPLQPAVQTMPSRGMAYLDPSSGTGMLTCRNLPPLEQGHAYQIWFVRGNERVSGGLLWPDRAGNGYTLIQVPTDLQSFDSIGLTDEPGTGSAWPTTPRVIGTQLSPSSQ